MRIYLIRHADPDYPAGTITPKGHKEAAALAETMPRLRPTHLYASPLGRAKDTAAYTVEKTGLPLTVEPWTRERNGGQIQRPPENETMPIWDDLGEITRRMFHPGPPPKDWINLPPYDAPDFSDTLQTIADESDAFLSRHGYHREGAVYRVDETVANVRDQRIAVFCHAGFGMAWLAHLLELPPPLVFCGIFLGPSSVTTLFFEERTPGVATPRCIGLSDISHLHLAGLPPQPRGLRGNIP